MYSPFIKLLLKDRIRRKVLQMNWTMGGTLDILEGVFHTETRVLCQCPRGPLTHPYQVRLCESQDPYTSFSVW